MHELALTQAIVEMCAGRAAGARVRRVTLKVGRTACVAPEALRFCYELAAQGTALEGSKLEILAGEGEELLVKEMEVH